MSYILVLKCSPHMDGVTDQLADTFVRQVESIHDASNVKTIPIREYKIKPCIGCGHCAKEPHTCIFDEKDEADKLFRYMADAISIVIFSPIYFYGVPAHFKALIDRSQKFWNCGSNNDDHRIAQIFLVGGRKRGGKLFEGALLTLKYFFQTLNIKVVKEKTYYGLNSVSDLEAKPEIRRDVEHTATILLEMMGKNYCAG